jgi:hypothetical protein
LVRVKRYTETPQQAIKRRYTGGDNALPLSVTKSYLLAANIAVKSESCGYLTEVAFAEVCGGATGELHIFTIDESDAMLAENIGFTLPDSLVIEDNYEIISCNN